MVTNHITRAFSLLLAGLALYGGGPARAELIRIQVASRTEVLAGKPFGTVGAYQKIIGKAFFAVDPLHPANTAIVDLDKAPRDAQGRVNFSADLYALIPKDAARGNGVALIDVLNRGRKGLLGYFDLAPRSNNPVTEADFGDGFLLRHGYALVWVGWQFDIPSRGDLMGLDAPPVLDKGRPITGRVTTQFVPDSAADTYPLDDLANYADTTRYLPVDPASSENRLTVRDGFRADPQTIPRELWQFGRAVSGTVTPDISAAFLKGGFAPGHVYELSYEAQGAVVAGLGLAALRDTASALKNTSLPVSARYTVAFGPSQDGRLLRELMYEGFNADEFGRRAFDGVIAHIGGAARSADFNARFARPNGAGAFEPSLFPYLDAKSRDPVTGRMDGLLSKLSPELQPKVFYTNSSVEYWGLGRAAALTHTTLDGRSDAAIPDNVRIYHFAGTQHLPGGYLGTPGQQQPNPNQYGWGLRALLVAMDHWLKDGNTPPESRHPRLSDHSLVPQQDLDFPKLPGVRSPLSIPAGYRADLGVPPKAPLLPFLVPQVDRDGNEIGGILLPDVAVPLATYTGWNFRNPSVGQPGELLPLIGSYIPLPLTREAAEEVHDPRLSITDRYGSRSRYEALVTDRAEQLVQQGYLLREDIQAVTAAALARWDQMTRGTPLAQVQ